MKILLWVVLAGAVISVAIENQTDVFTAAFLMVQIPITGLLELAALVMLILTQIDMELRKEGATLIEVIFGFAGICVGFFALVLVFNPDEARTLARALNERISRIF